MSNAASLTEGFFHTHSDTVWTKTELPLSSVILELITGLQVFPPLAAPLYNICSQLINWALPCKDIFTVGHKNYTTVSFYHK